MTPTAGVDEAQKNDPQTIEAGRYLDSLVAERVLGFRRADTWMAAYPRHYTDPQLPEHHQSTPHYSRDMAAAWRAVESLRARGLFLQLHFEGPKSNQWVAYFHEDDTDDFIGADTAEYLAPTAELAICRAALDAAAQMEDQS